MTQVKATARALASLSSDSHSYSWDSLQEACTAMNIGDMVADMLAYGARGVMLKESRISSSVGSVKRVNPRENIFSGELYDKLQFK